MATMRVAYPVVMVLLAGCSSGGASTTGRTPRAARVAEPAPTRANEPERAPASCRVERAERMSIAQGEMATSTTGLRVRYESATREHYDDGRFDVMLSLRIESGAGSTGWLPSALAPPVWIALLDHCVRIVTSTEARIELDVGLALFP